MKPQTVIQLNAIINYIINSIIISMTTTYSP
jgi:hypothetical protein